MRISITTVRATRERKFRNVDQRPEIPVTTLDRLGLPGGYAALTFDDGPAPCTGALLDTLERTGVAATFFVLGTNIAGAEESLRRMVELGCTVEIHGWDHTAMTDLSRAELVTGVEETRAAIRAATGRDPRYVRPPYGAADPGVLATIGELGLIPAFWSVHATDWTRPGTTAIERAITAGLRPGAVALLHDGGGDRSQTVAAVPAIVAEAGRRRLRLVALP